MRILNIWRHFEFHVLPFRPKFLAWSIYISFSDFPRLDFFNRRRNFCQAWFQWRHFSSPKVRLLCKRGGGYNPPLQKEIKTTGQKSSVYRLKLLGFKHWLRPLATMVRFIQIRAILLIIFVRLVCHLAKAVCGSGTVNQVKSILEINNKYFKLYFVSQKFSIVYCKKCLFI